MHPYAFLVSASGLRTAEAAAPAAAKQMDFHTQVQSSGGARTAATRSSSARPTGVDVQALVVPLRKATGNPFPDRVSVGRAVNCDIAIRDPSISKLHGHFRDVTRDSAVFTDAKSSNGTRIDGVVVQPGVAVRIERHGLITLGRVRLQLVTATDVYDWL